MSKKKAGAKLGDNNKAALNGKKFADSKAPARKQEATKNHAQSDKHKDSAAHSVPHEGFWADFFVKLVVLALSIVLVRLAHVAKVDVQKDHSHSFLSDYIEGKLDRVDHITQMLVAAAASVFFDFGVIYYHLTNAPHPKFVLSTSRRISIFTHLISGIVEIVAGVAAFVITDHEIQKTAALVTSVASITHSLTAYYQTNVVFGAKGIMVPGYIYAITIHITFATRLFLNPTSVVNLLCTFLTLHIYVWCRFFVFFFRLFSAFNGYHYTIAITLSGALLFPYTMGPVGNFSFLGLAALYCVLQALLSDSTGKHLAHKLFTEHERYALVTADAVTRWKGELANSTTMGADKNADVKLARQVFNHFDTDHSGKLGLNEVNAMVNSLGTSTHTAKKIMAIADSSADGAISFEEFYRFVWNIGSMKGRLAKLPHLPAKKDSDDKDQARLVFDMLDIDDSGYIEVAELSILLSQWGMPPHEADSYLAVHGAGTKRQINFDTFYTKMAPVWKFALKEVFEA